MGDVVDVDFAAARAAREAAADQELDPTEEAAFQADAALQGTLSAARLSASALGGLRRQVLPFAAEPGDALLPASVLFAMVRELLEHRARRNALCDAYFEHESAHGACPPDGLVHDVATIVVSCIQDEILETITDPEVVLAGTVELG